MKEGCPGSFVVVEGRVQEAARDIETLLGSSMKSKQKDRMTARQQKQAQFSRPAAKKHNKKLVIIGALAAIGFIGYFSGRDLNDQAPATTVTASAIGTTGSVPGDISMPLTDFPPGTAKFFNYVGADKTSMRFFVIKSSDGAYRAALDACDVCYREKRGYHQAGDDMVCRKCGQRFPSALVNEVTGGCNPVALSRTVADGRIHIQAAALESLKKFLRGWLSAEL